MDKLSFLSVVVIIGILVSPIHLNSMQLRRELAQEQRLLSEVETELQYLNSIIERRELMKRHQQSGADFLINESFNDVLRELEAAYQQRDEQQIIRKHREIKLIFSDITAVRDSYLFYDAVYDYYILNFAGAMQKLVTLTDSYPQSVRIRQAFTLLLNLYLNNGNYRELIGLYNRFQHLADNQNRYQLAHAYFNIGEYSSAQDLFERLVDDRVYGFRSRVMLGLLHYASFNTDRAIDILIDLSDSYSSREPYYDFVILSLARILAQQGEFQASLQYYNRYVDLKGGERSDQVLYEIALVHKASGNYNQANSILSRIITSPEDYELYADAIAMIAGLMVYTDNLEASTELINDILVTNNAYYDLLQRENDLIERLRQNVQRYMERSNPELRSQFEQLAGQFNDVVERDIATVEIGIDRREREFARMISEEYVLLLAHIKEINDLAERIRNRPNDAQVAQVDRRITEIDSLRTNLITAKFLYTLIKEETGDTESFEKWGFYSRNVYLTKTNQLLLDNHSAARDLARRIVSYENQLAERSGSMSANQLEELNTNIALLYEEAESLFGVVSEEDDYIRVIEAELQYSIESRKELLEIKDLVARYYHQRLSERLKRLNRESFTESDFFYSYISRSIDETVNQIENVNLKYDYALLDVLFQENIRRNQEYQRLMQETEISQTNEEGGQ